jgi:hypothetical protein
VSDTDTAEKRTRTPNPYTRYAKAHEKAEKARRAHSRAADLAEKARQADEKARALSALKDEAEVEEQEAYEGLQEALAELQAPDADEDDDEF